jgi:RES domain-containing protein
MVEYPDYPRLLAMITVLAARAVKFHGVLYRACTPVYANTRDLLTGEGARRTGGRWNAPGTFPVVYLAERVEGSIAETLGVAGHYGFDPAVRLPMTLVAIDAALERVLDLTVPSVRKALNVTCAAMIHCPWRGENAAGREALTQAIGRATQEAGLQGLLAPSSVKRTFRNLNVFPTNLSASDTLKIRSADKLPLPPISGVM